MMNMGKGRRDEEFSVVRAVWTASKLNRSPAERARAMREVILKAGLSTVDPRDGGSIFLSFGSLAARAEAKANADAALGEVLDDVALMFTAARVWQRPGYDAMCAERFALCFGRHRHTPPAPCSEEWFRLSAPLLRECSPEQLAQLTTSLSNQLQLHLPANYAESLFQEIEIFPLERFCRERGYLVSGLRRLMLEGRIPREMNERVEMYLRRGPKVLPVARLLQIAKDDTIDVEVRAERMGLLCKKYLWQGTSPTEASRLIEAFAYLHQKGTACGPRVEAVLVSVVRWARDYGIWNSALIRFSHLQFVIRPFGWLRIVPAESEFQPWCGLVIERVGEALPGDLSQTLISLARAGKVFVPGAVLRAISDAVQRESAWFLNPDYPATLKLLGDAVSELGKSTRTGPDGVQAMVELIELFQFGCRGSERAG